MKPKELKETIETPLQRLHDALTVVDINLIAEEQIIIRDIDYEMRGGKGRPRNKDYVVIKRKDLMDFNCCQVLKAGFSSNTDYSDCTPLLG